jgi:predicted signal transduction protein with EAL and GGDEF domain
LAKPFKSPWPLALHRIGFAPLGHSRDVREVEGHDALIVAFAERLAGVVGPDHGLARVDGRNFIVAQNVRTPQTIIELASEMLEAMAASYRVGTQAFDVAVNVGSAIAPVHGQSVERLDKSAALALKHSRARGPNVVSVFDLSMEEPDLTGQRPDSRPGYHRAAS